MKRLRQGLMSPVVWGTLGLLALSAVVWWFGPLLAFGDSRPLDGLWGRIGLLVLLWAAWIGRLAYGAWRRRQTNAALLAGLGSGPSASDKEAQVLAQRFNDAVTRLKAQRGGSWLGGGQHLYELPWYVFIGAPGSGKTTALMNAGLQFLLGDASKGAVQGVGGTRNCEWWFTQDAVLVDTAGRYTTQESDREVDASAWDNFLALLKKTRPRQPINGVLLTVNIQDLLQQGTPERAEHAAKLRERLQELQTKLGVRAPVYVMVTKADLIGGFNESFGGLGQDDRAQVWGFTFDDAAASAADPMPQFGALYQQLQQRLVQQLVGRLEAERDVLRRSAIFAFPQEFAALQPVLAEFLRQVFAGGGTLEQAPRVRGVYFTSGTQEGSPIDRVMGALGRSFGLDARAASAGGAGKSFFLNRLLREVVFTERGLGILNAAAERRRRGLRAGTAVAIGVASLAVLVGWGVSRQRNLGLAEQVAAGLPALKQQVDALPAPGSADVAALPAVLGSVRDAVRAPTQAAGYAVAKPPLLNDLGLYQGDKLDGAAQQAYRRLLEKTLMPRVARRLEERLRAADNSNLENAYEALKTYLMLYTPEQFDAATLRAWITLDWDRQYTAMTPEQRAGLDAHLDAALALGAPRAVAKRDDALVASTREMLAAYPLEYRVYSRIKRQFRPGEVPDFTVAGAAGPSAAQVFERTSKEPLTKGISGLYTRQGHERLIKTGVQAATAQLAREEPWVLGTKADPARLRDVALGGGVVDKVRRLYYEDYIKAWDALIADVKVVKPTSLDRGIAITRTLAGVDSPLAAWLRAVAAETRLVADPAAASPLDKAAAEAKAKAAALAGAGPVATPGAGPLESMVDNHFRDIHRQVTGTPPPLDETLKLFGELNAQLSAVDAAQKSKSPPPPGGGAEKVKAAAAQQPPAVRAMVEALADAGASQGRSAEIASLGADLKPITEFCNRAITGRYPFASGSRSDVLPEDLGQLFGGGGLMDSFFQARLAALVDTGAATWAYKPTGDGSRPVQAAALVSFQQAQRIRDVFFRSGGKAPSMRIEMRLAEIDPELKELVLDVDGQVQKLSPGGASVAVAWPSTRLAAQIKLSSALGEAGPKALFEGPWALFRLFDRYEMQPSSTPERFSLLVNLDGRKARLEVIAASVFNPFQMREIKQFRCPQSL